MFKDFNNSIVISSVIGQRSGKARQRWVLVVARCGSPRLLCPASPSPTSLGSICSLGGLSSSFSSFFLFPALRWLELLQLYGGRAVWAVRKTVRAVVGIRI